MRMYNSRQGRDKNVTRFEVPIIIKELQEGVVVGTGHILGQVKVKVKQSRYRPGVAQEGSRKLKFPDYMTTAQDGGKVVSLTHRPPLPPRKCSWYSFLLEAESTPRAIVRSEGLCQ